MIDNAKELLIELMLNECVDTFRKLWAKAGGSDASKYGTFPPYAVVVYKGYDPRWRGKGDPIRAWRIDSESVKEIPLPPPKLDINRRNGMYYDMGFFAFAFPKDMSVVRLSMTLGPRYGRGYSRKLEISDGEIKLGDRFDEWVS